jgi:hypothetical protein
MGGADLGLSTVVGLVIKAFLLHFFLNKLYFLLHRRILVFFCLQNKRISFLEDEIAKLNRQKPGSKIPLSTNPLGK